MEYKPAVRIEYGAFDGPKGSVTDKLAIFRESNGKSVNWIFLITADKLIL
jgi:hypothetical protein